MSTFNIALSGLNAASSTLQVTSNNIANANTTGFKSGEAMFGDVYAAASNDLSNSLIGSGVQLQEVRQDFGQGNVNFDSNTLDLAINGGGMFTLSNNGSLVYSRAGAFGPDANGYVVNSAGQRLQVYPATATGTIDTGHLSDLQLSDANSPPAATTSVQLGLNLPAGAAVPSDAATFNPTDPDSYNSTASTTVYDSLGDSHTVNLYFTQTSTPNQWTVNSTVDGTVVGAPQTITYSASGAITSPSGGKLTLPATALPSGAAPLGLTLDLSTSTQYGGSFAVNSLQQDGYATGLMSGLTISGTGIIQANYTNGQSRPLGQIALSNFTSPQGLQQLGNTSWAQTYASGPAITGTAQSGTFGSIQSGALEASNVDVSSQLVNLITAQRNYQANAKSIQTESTITQTLLGIQ
ncbi:MAG TPA: flagellar hook protein FlgE [Nevskiaceae bacterium]|nr:flagellar hook protein FlgE [Nevskiaceae bacterium]